MHKRKTAISLNIVKSIEDDDATERILSWIVIEKNN